MTKFRLALLLATLGSALFAANAATLSPGQNLTAAVEAAVIDEVISLNPGVYTTNNAGNPTALYNIAGSFGVSKRVTIRGLGATPGDVILRGGPAPAAGFAVHFLKYGGVGDPSGGTMENLTIDTSPGGIRVHEFVGSGRLTDITLKNVVVNTPAGGGGGFGVLLYNNDRMVLDNVTVTSNQAGFNLVDTSDSLIMNSTVTSTVNANAPGLSVNGGSSNVFVGNIIGSPKTNPAFDGNYSLNAGGVVFNNSKGNRFENNIVQGFRADGLDYTSTDLTGVGVPPAQVTTNSTDNYVGKNTVVSTGFAANLAGGSGIWSNCGSHNTWLYANDSSGSVEGGLTIWNSRSNMALANSAHGHGTVGLFVSGGNETLSDCSVGGGTLYTSSKPAFNYLRNNAAYFNRAEQIIIRSADNTDVSLNFASPRNGRTGSLQPPADPANGQGAITFQTDARFPFSTGFRMVSNISSENMRGIWNDDGKNNTGIEYYLNRVIGSTFNRITTPTTLFIDTGYGGNYWSQFVVSGNPSSTAYSGVSHDSLNNVGRVIDRYPHQSENLGRGNISVSEPRAGVQIAQGTRRTVRWNAQGCLYIDLVLDGATFLATDAPNTGYAVVTIPGGAGIGAHTIVVSCKNSSGTALYSANSPTFNVTSSNLQLMAPGRDDVFNTGQEIFVAWKKAASVGAVAVDLSTDGGATFPTSLATGVTKNYVRVTIPGTVSQSQAVIRVTAAGGLGDTTDGVFGIRGTSGFGFTNVPGGRVFVMGVVERLEWTSQQSSRLVSIRANGTSIADNLPDRGYFDWIPPAFGAVAVTLAIDFKDTNGTLIGTSTSAAGSLRYPGTITFGALSTIPAGNSQSIPVSTNAGTAITLVSNSPSVCSVSGTTVTAVANGICVISGSTPGNGTFAGVSQVTTTFTVATVTNPPRLTGISTRMQVLTVDKVLIGGFIISGSVPKKVVINARGPSLTGQGVAGALSDPTLTLVPASGPATTNDNWMSSPNAAEIQALGYAPPHALESSILATLNPGAYTAIVSGVGGATGVGIVEIFEIDHPDAPLTGISTRGQVLTVDNVMIGGFIIQGTAPQTVVVRARGPSLTAQGVSGVLANPSLQLVYASDGTTLTNDDWQTAGNAGTLSAIGYAPSDPRESAILVTLPPGAYTAIVSGVGGSTGVALVEVYAP